MAENTCKVVIGQCSYKGPHKDCFDQHLEFLHYLGRLSERSRWMNHFGGIDQAADPLPALPKLDQMKDDGLSELVWGDPVFEFATATVTGSSLIGRARDAILQRALEWRADYVFFFDDDMVFAWDAFLRLWRHRKPVIGALAFTAREPIAPVLYNFKRDWDFTNRRERLDIEPLLDYPRDELIQVDAIGTGVVLIDTAVLKRIPGPWFHGELGAQRKASGEDIFFCVQAYQAGVEIWCDTSVKAAHAENVCGWMDETRYLASKEETKNAYDRNSDVSQLQAAL